MSMTNKNEIEIEFRPARVATLLKQMYNRCFDGCVPYPEAVSDSEGCTLFDLKAAIDLLEKEEDKSIIVDFGKEDSYGTD